LRTPLGARLRTRVAEVLRRTLAVGLKELRQLVRDRWTLAMIVGIPAIQLVLFGYAINLDVRHVSSALLDRSQSQLSRKLVGELEATQTFRVTRSVTRESDAIELLERSRVGAVIVIPPDLDRHLYRGRGAEVSILADATNPTVAAAIATAGNGLGRSLAERYRPWAGDAGAAALRPPPVDRARFGPEAEQVRTEPVRIAVLPLYNPERRTGVFIVPGLVGVILTMTMMVMTALAVVRERERGTFEFLIP
jgi:ABC-2 type transport system permease protein